MVVCVFCYKQEFVFLDDVMLSEGFDGEYIVWYFMGLSMVKYYFNGYFFWDEWFGILEEQVLLLIQDFVEMGFMLDEFIYCLEIMEFYLFFFESVYGDVVIIEDCIVWVFVQFICFMVSYQFKWDQGWQQAFLGLLNQGLLFNFMDQENFGKVVFFDLELGNCVVCYGIDVFIVFEVCNNGLDIDFFIDLGLGGVMGILQEIGFFKVFFFCNIGLIVFYMYDGCFEMLEEVVDYYNSNVQFYFNLFYQFCIGLSGLFCCFDLMEEEQEAFVVFFYILIDEVFIVDECWLDFFCGMFFFMLQLLL